MKNTNHEVSDPIPADLLFDIFSRVPAKSIGRFRCVSKYWGSILGQPYFTDLFLSKSLTRPRLLFASLVDKKLIFYSSPQPQNPDDNSCVVATRYHTSFPEYYPIQTCTGLVLLRDCETNSVYLICNPLTGESVTVPKLQTEETECKIERIHVGYEPINKQFKLLCLTSSDTHRVLTLENGELSWRIVECKFHYERHIYIFREICINGVLYFAATFQGSFTIVAFDLRSEKFGFIKLDNDMLQRPYGGRLINNKGKLGVYEFQDEFEEQQYFELWVLEDAGKHRWSKRIYVHMWSDELRYWSCGYFSTGMTDTGEIVLPSCRVFRYLESYCLHFYSLERNTFTRVNFQGFNELDSPTTFLDYVENMKLL